MRKDADCQTEQQTSSLGNLINMGAIKVSSSSPVQQSANEDTYITTYQGYQRVGKNLELKVKIEEGQKSGTTIVTFEEIRSRERCQICLLES